MYGIVNKAVEDMVISSYGNHKWELIKHRSGIEVDFFISTHPYDDQITFKLVNAVSEEMDLPIASVLHSLGEWWILKTGKEKYGGLMEAGGRNLSEFLVNLPLFHNRI